MKGNATNEGKEEDNINPLKDCDAEDKCDNVISLQEENLASTFETFWNISNTIQGLPILVIPYAVKIGRAHV